MRGKQCNRHIIGTIISPMNIGPPASTHVSQLPTVTRSMAMQPGFPSDEQYAMGKNRQDAVGQSPMPQNTHMHSEYAPDDDNTVRDMLETMHRPLQPQDEPARAMDTPSPGVDDLLERAQFIENDEDDALLFSSTAPGASAAVRLAKSPVAKGWLLSNKEISVLVLTVLLAVICGLLPLDRYVSLYLPCIAGNATVVVVLMRAILIGGMLVFLSRMFGLQ